MLVKRVLLPAALALLAALPAPGVRADEAAPIDRLLGGLASADAVSRHAALATLGARLPLAGADLVRATRLLGDVIRQRPPAEGALAVRLLARLGGEKARDRWLEALDPEADPAVFAAAVAGAADRREDADGVKALLAIACDPKAPPARRALAFEALGHVGGAAGRLALQRPAATGSGDGSEPWLLAAGRALGLRHLGGPVAGGALLALLAHPDEAARVHAWEGLVALTRQNLPPDAKAWRAWVAEHPGAFVTGAAQAPVAEEPTDPGSADPDARYAGPEPAHVPRYYGVPIAVPRSHVVFCLDVSQSMYGRGIEQARGELTRTLLSFPSTYAFDVIAFNERLLPYADGLVPAHPVVKDRALRWLAALETISYTNLYDAVETAFGYAGIGDRARPDPTRLDAVFLLSDGAPNRGRYRREAKVVEAIAALSRRRVPVHAVAAGEEVFPLLQRIAAATGGRFVDAFAFE